MKRTLITLILAILVAGTYVAAQDYQVVAEKSILRWSGKKVGKSHDGRISLKEASFTLNEGKFASGEFVIDMNSIIVDDVKDPNMNARLLGHLKSDDFFSVATFPVARLSIKESSAFENGEASVNGDLTIKGKTHPVTFTVKRTGDMFQSRVVFDRSLYDVRFGSGKFFENIGDNAIDDMIPIDVTIVAVKK